MVLGGGSVLRISHHVTAICGFRALLHDRYVVEVTTIGAASDCTRGARQARCESASVEAAEWLILLPLA